MVTTLDIAPALLTVEQAARYLALGRSKTYALVANGTLPAVKLGRSVRVPRGRLDAWLEEQAQRAGEAG